MTPSNICIRSILILLLFRQTVQFSKTCRIREHSPINSVVCSINSRTSQNQNLYLLNFKNLFKINSINQLVVINTIDRESLDAQTCKPGPENDVNPYCSLLVDIVNKTKPEVFQDIQIRVEVEDINDNSPVFEKISYTIDIDENIPPGHVHPLPVARDSDYGINAEITYSLEGKDKNLFRLIYSKNSKPKLRTMKKFDREEKDKYELALEATDKGDPKRTGEIRLYIKIRDLNDHAPEFNFPSDTVIQVREDEQEGAQIYDAKVTDKDADSQVTVSLNPNADSDVKKHFQISSSTGLTLIYRLDYETLNQRYIIPLIAVDNGTPSLTTSATLIVTVIDVNDNAPQITIDSITDSSNNFKVMENKPKDSFIAMVTVFDADSDVNGMVDCTLSEQDGKPNFELTARSYADYQNKKKSYRILTLREFDREIRNHYRISIKCKDKGIPQQSSEQTITVWIDDENDNAPSFSKQHYQAKIMENALPETEIIVLRATDPDVGMHAKTIYKIPIQYQNLVRINNPSNGVVTSVIPFDRELNKTITFKALALDEGRNDLNNTIDVTVEIEDENDCSPVFDKHLYSFKIKEGHTGWIGKIHAYDNDSNDNGEINYSLTGFTKDNIWIIRSDGNIFSDRGNLLDREIQSIHHLTVEAKDRGALPRSSSVTVKIQLEDINDNAPRFIQVTDSRYKVVISDSMQPGSLVTKVTATDDDENDNGKISYLLTPNSFFTINEESGEIFINKTLTPNTKLPRPLIVVARDHGVPSLSTSLFVSLTFAKDQEENVYVSPNIGGEKQNNGAKKNERHISNGNFKWSSKEVLISLTVGSVILIVVCGGLLLLYVWCQSNEEHSAVKTKEEFRVTERGTAASPSNVDESDLSCISFCSNMCSKKKSTKGFSSNFYESSYQQQQQQQLKHHHHQQQQQQQLKQQWEISQPLQKLQVQEISEEGNMNRIDVLPLVTHGSPDTWRIQRKLRDEYSPDMDSAESRFIYAASLQKAQNTYEPPLKQLKNKSTNSTLQNYTAIQMPTYSMLRTNPVSSKYDTEVIDSTFISERNPLNFAIPNPRISNSFV